MADTIFAHSSGQPPAAIAVIRISGAQAHEAARRLAGSLPEPRRAVVRTLRRADGEWLDDALVIRFDGPGSATGEDLVELHCHGGRAVVRAVLQELEQLPDLRLAEPGEFTRRALGNGRLDLTEAEGLADLLQAETEQQRRAAGALAGGALSRKVERWREQVVILSAQAEAAIDYVGDEDETAIDVVSLAQSVRSLVVEWEQLLAEPRTERLRDGIRIVLAGPPNAGKSSLLNALVGEERAIVTPIPGTTRDLVEVPMALDGVPLVLVDTAGLRETADTVEQIGVGRAEKQVQAADLLLWLGSPDDVPLHPNLIALHAKADVRGDVPRKALAVSSLTGAGLPELRRLLVQRARELLPAESSLSLNQRQADALEQAAAALSGLPDDLILLSDGLRLAREALDRLSGRSGIEDVLDSLFGRFCLGK